MACRTNNKIQNTASGDGATDDVLEANNQQAKPMVNSSAQSKNMRSQKKKDLVEVIDSGSSEDDVSSDADFNAGKKKKVRNTKAMKLQVEREKDVKNRPWAYTGGRKRPDLGYDQYWKKIADRDAAIDKLTVRAQKAKDKVGQLNEQHQEENKNIREAEEDLRQRLINSEKLAKERDEAIQKLKDERFKIFKKGSVPTTPDNEVQASLVDIFEDVKTWATTWALEPQVLPDKKVVEASWGSALTDDSDAFATDRGIRAATQGRVPAKVVLNGLVNHAISCHIFQHPFGFLKTSSQGNYDADARDKVDWLINFVKATSPTDANNLRVSLMASFSANQAPKNDAAQVEKLKHARILRASHHAHIVKMILAYGKGFLGSTQSKLQKQREAELEDIVQRFMDLSGRLNAEKPRTELLSLKGLSHFPFGQNHKYFSGHRGLKLKEDADDNSPDAHEAGIAGRPIDFVVEPAVLRYGNADGEGIDKPRVIERAKVWMVRPQDLEEPSTGQHRQLGLKIIVKQATTTAEAAPFFEAATKQSTSPVKATVTTQDPDPDPVIFVKESPATDQATAQITGSQKRGNEGDLPIAKRARISPSKTLQQREAIEIKSEPDEPNLEAGHMKRPVKIS